MATTISVAEIGDLPDVQKVLWRARAEGLGVQMWNVTRPTHGTGRTTLRKATAGMIRFRVLRPCHATLAHADWPDDRPGPDPWRTSSVWPMTMRAVRVTFMLLLAALCALAGAASFAFGTCHDVGGFCSGEFNSTNIEAYAGGVVLMSTSAVVVVAAVTRRRWVVASTGFAVAASLTGLAVVLETVK